MVKDPLGISGGKMMGTGMMGFYFTGGTVNISVYEYHILDKKSSLLL